MEGIRAVQCSTNGGHPHCTQSVLTNGGHPHCTQSVSTNGGHPHCTQAVLTNGGHPHCTQAVFNEWKPSALYSGCFQRMEAIRTVLLLRDGNCCRRLFRTELSAGVKVYLHGIQLAASPAEDSCFMFLRNRAKLSSCVGSIAGNGARTVTVWQ